MVESGVGHSRENTKCNEKIQGNLRGGNISKNIGTKYSREGHREIMGNWKN